MGGSDLCMELNVQCDFSKTKIEINLKIEIYFFRFVGVLLGGVDTGSIYVQYVQGIQLDVPA